jgi:hypothetical protein
MNAAKLSESEVAAALWALSGTWRVRLAELVARRADLGATPDLRHMSASEQFRLLVNIERREAHLDQGEAPK